MLDTKRWLPLLLFSVLILAACGESVPELAQAADVIHYMMKPQHLSRSAFYVAFPDGKPTQYVSYIFSEVGVAEWPYSETWADEMEREQMKAIGAPMVPEDVALVPLSPDPCAGKQVGVMFDDSRGVVIVEGYVDPAADPVLTREWKLLKVDPDPFIEDIYRSYVEMGMSDQAF
jgi:hypothetical protein